MSSSLHNLKLPRILKQGNIIEPETTYTETRKRILNSINAILDSEYGSWLFKNKLRYGAKKTDVSGTESRVCIADYYGSEEFLQLKSLVFNYLDPENVSDVSLSDFYSDRFLSKGFKSASFSLNTRVLNTLDDYHQLHTYLLGSLLAEVKDDYSELFEEISFDQLGSMSPAFLNSVMGFYVSKVFHGFDSTMRDHGHGVVRSYEDFVTAGTNSHRLSGVKRRSTPALRS